MNGRTDERTDERTGREHNASEACQSGMTEAQNIVQLLLSVNRSIQALSTVAFRTKSGLLYCNLFAKLSRKQMMN